jgi:hypothetical protein
MIFFGLKSFAKLNEHKADSPGGTERITISGRIIIKDIHDVMITDRTLKMNENISNFIITGIALRILTPLNSFSITFCMVYRDLTAYHLIAVD